MDALTALEQFAAPLIRRLEPAARARLARRIATTLQKSQRDRIGQQKAPDGSPYPRRKNQKRQKAGRVRRRKMFAKLRQSKHLKARGNASEATVMFVRRAAAIARVHQDGLLDQVRRGGPRVRYERRVLLGFAPDDRQMVHDALLAHLSGE
ncbi:phage virion morphogenesis protein [Pseudoxanthomonas winnipegensis]|uniref:Phage virion morphogenesis protein n=1 Tax=Pseudoxanthomonas winnipegensis TaxID=2480810 RepID=A0A4Q8LCZ0_9GAMM|nr:phage virion morphogenesis protein [Pseudoxanthomonas winnipegensis]TAA26571.1 phage virion morphogenesis protein [Pseudoxanthomonas winnipegensis]